MYYIFLAKFLVQILHLVFLSAWLGVTIFLYFVSLPSLEKIEDKLVCTARQIEAIEGYTKFSIILAVLVFASLVLSAAKVYVFGAWLIGFGLVLFLQNKKTKSMNYFLGGHLEVAKKELFPAVNKILPIIILDLLLIMIFLIGKMCSF